MRRLDPTQAAAARSDAPVQLTLAGPGSGKTSTLTGRFVYLTRQGVDPHRILAVTFTRKAADEMRSRIASLLEPSAPARLEVMTFHAFAFRLLRRNPAIAGLPEQFQLWDAPEQRRVFLSQRMYWNEDADILDIIGGAKERLLNAETFAARIDPNDEVLTEAVKYFRVYQHALDQAGAIDFADMVPLLVKAMAEDSAYRQAITGAYDHVLVDEYQDVNPGQIKLLDHFVHDGVRLWVVGDDDQTLYSFRASDVRHILDFTNRHTGVVTHLLHRNYRSAPEIVRAAKRLIGHNRTRMDKDCHPVVSTPGEIVIRGYATPVIEARQVARAIVELIGQGAVPDSIAVLYRSGAVGLAFQGILRELGVPFAVRGGADLWQSAAARLVHGALLYLRDGESAEAMSRIGSNKRGEIVRNQLDRLPAAIRGDFEVTAEHVRDIVGDAVPGRASSREKAEWHAIVDAVVELALTCKTLPELENKIADQSRTLRNLPDNAIVLSTIHSAKGLEWDTVFVAGLEDGVLPHINAEDVEEERRIAYVGVTRAKHRLGLTYAAERYGDKARPSPFLFEIAGKNNQDCAWSGPRTKGADGRLPLLSAEDLTRRIGRPADGGSITHARQPKRTGAPSRPRVAKSQRNRRRTEPIDAT
jgi:DNA helicase II / ATP-dependent DNA helicase PcrA